MNRRDNLKSLGLITSHVLFPKVLLSFFSSCTSKERIAAYKYEYFNQEEIELLSELADMIIPATDSPGASEAGVHVFIDQYVKHCYTKDLQKQFRSGLNEWAKNKNLDPKERSELLKKREEESHSSDSPESEFIRNLKNLTLHGYFFSANGAAAASYVQIPGKFEGCIDLKNDQYAELLNGMT